MRNLAKLCTCGDCEDGSMSSRSLDFWSSECARNDFFSRICLCTADILAISLFEGPDKLSVSHSCIQDLGGFQWLIRNILKSGEQTDCTPLTVLATLLKLLDTRNSIHTRILNRRDGLFPVTKARPSIPNSSKLATYVSPGILHCTGHLVYCSSMEKIIIGVSISRWHLTGWTQSQ